MMTTITNTTNNVKGNRIKYITYLATNPKDNLNHST